MSETESINPSKEYGSDNKNNNNSKIINRGYRLSNCHMKI